LQVYHHENAFSPQLSWHFHVLLPWQRFEWSDCTERPDVPADPLTDDGAVSVPLHSTSVLASLSWAHCAGDYFAHQPSSKAASDSIPARLASVPVLAFFMESLLLTAPLRAVTGVALC
jgi:hypothetical protein